MRVAGFLCLALCLTFPLSASPPSATLYGSVSAVGGARLPGTVITLEHLDSGQTFTVVSGARGLFRAANLPPGSYRLTTELSGFLPQVLSEVMLEDDATQNLELYLEVEPTLSEVVTVIGEAPIDSLEAEAIRESSARDVGEALAETTGVWKVRRGGIANDVVVRGFQRGDLNVFIDGQRIYGACPNRMDPPAFHVDFSEVERIEVSKGPFDLKNQGSLGGTVNVVTRKPEEGLRVNTNLAAGSYSFINPSATVSYGTREFSVLGGFSYRSSDAYEDGAGQKFTEITNYKTSAIDEKAFEIGTAWGSAGWSPTEGNQLQVSYTRQDVGRTFYPYLKMDAVYDDTDRLSVRYDREDPSGSLTKLAALAYFNRVDHWMTDDYRTSSVGAPRDYSMATLAKTQTYGGRVDAEISAVSLGLEAFDRFWGAETEMAGMAYRPQYSLPDVTIRDLGFYAEYAHDISASLSLTAGGRLDHATSSADEAKANTNLYFAYNNTRSTNATDTFPSGKVRINYRAAAGMELSGGLGHTVRLPEPSERFFALKRMGADWVGNPELAPSRNTGLDAALSYGRTGLYLGASLYINWVHDYVALHDQERVNGTPGVMNAKARSYTNLDATIWGGELDAVWTLSDRLNLAGDLAYVRGTKEVSPEQNIFSENVAEIPPLRSSVRLRYDTWKWFAWGEGVFSARQENVDTDLGEAVTPAYAIANVRVGVRYERLTISVGVNNIFDKLYFEHLSYHRDPFSSGVRVPEPGRNLSLNVAYPF